MIFKSFVNCSGEKKRPDSSYVFLGVSVRMGRKDIDSMQLFLSFSPFILEPFALLKTHVLTEGSRD